MGVTRLMANEWAKHGINVNAIAPGYMATNNTQQLRADESVVQRFLTVLRRVVGAAKPSDGADCLPASRASDTSTVTPLLSTAAGWRAKFSPA
ncbi:SDR family oxidoreductase [Shigella flexneri]